MIIQNNKIKVVKKVRSRKLQVRLKNDILEMTQTTSFLSVIKFFQFYTNKINFSQCSKSKNEKNTDQKFKVQTEQNFFLFIY